MIYKTLHIKLKIGTGMNSGRECNACSIRGTC